MLTLAALTAALTPAYIIKWLEKTTRYGRHMYINGSVRLGLYGSNNGGKGVNNVSLYISGKLNTVMEGYWNCQGSCCEREDCD